jgi:hypothetical protein
MSYRQTQKRLERHQHGQAIFESSAAMLLFLTVFVALTFCGALVYVLISSDEKLKLICTQAALAAQQDNFFLGMPRKDVSAERTPDANAIRLAVQLGKAEGLPLKTDDIQIIHSTQEHGIDSTTCVITYGSFKLPALARIFPGISGRKVAITTSSVNSQPAPACLHLCANMVGSGPLSLAIPCYAGYRPGIGAMSVSTGRVLPNIPTVNFPAGNDPGSGGLRARHTYGLRLANGDAYRLDGPIDGASNTYDTSSLENQQPFIPLLAP